MKLKKQQRLHQKHENTDILPRPGGTACHTKYTPICPSRFVPLGLLVVHVCFILGTIFTQPWQVEFMGLAFSWYRATFVGYVFYHFYLLPTNFNRGRRLRYCLIDTTHEPARKQIRNGVTRIQVKSIRWKGYDTKGLIILTENARQTVDSFLLMERWPHPYFR